MANDPTPAQTINDVFAADGQDQSPLAEVDPNSVDVLVQERIAKIFNTPTKDVTDSELEAMVVFYRARRQDFLVQEQKKIAAGPRKRAVKAPKSVAEALNLSQAKDLDI